MRVKSLVFTTTPSVFLDFTISLGSQMQQSIPKAWNLFVYVLEGEGLFGLMDSSSVSAHHVWNNGSSHQYQLIMYGTTTIIIAKMGKVVDESLNVIRNRMMSDVGRLSGVEKELQFEKMWRE
ncbi:pirin-like protein [Tanacetum coccineum]